MGLSARGLLGCLSGCENSVDVYEGAYARDVVEGEGCLGRGVEIAVVAQGVILAYDDLWII